MDRIYSEYNENLEFTHCRMYKEGDQPENATQSLPDGIVKPKYDPIKDIFFETATIEEISECDEKCKKEKEFNLYLKRKSDGEQAYLALSAEFRLKKLSGEISEEEHRTKEDALKPVRNEIMFGQWKDGLFILEGIGSDVIGFNLYDRLHSQITNYINDNY